MFHSMRPTTTVWRTGRLLVMAAMVMALTAVGIVIAPTANAEAGESYRNEAYGGCIEPYQLSGAHAAWTGTCLGSGSTVDNWYPISVGTSSSGHSLVRLQSVAATICLDSNATDTGSVYTRGCNTGDYQTWEVFHSHKGYSDDYLTFKSWGAWTLQGRHRCMRATATNAELKLAVCDQQNTQQRFN
jgi:hypothetical protein